MTEIKSPSKTPSISPNTKTLFLPIIYLVIICLLFFFSIKTGYEKIVGQQKEIKAARNLENTLAEKEIELKESQNLLPRLVQPSSVALPSTNPSLMIISQVRALEEEQDIKTEDFGVSGAGLQGEDFSKLNVSFSINSTLDQFLVFVESTTNIAPIINYKNFTISSSGENVSAKMSAYSYWVQPPEQLPSITQPISKLSNEDIKMLQDLVKLKQPEFFDLKAESPNERVNPFAL